MGKRRRGQSVSPPPPASASIPSTPPATAAVAAAAEASEQPAKYTHLDSSSNLHGASSSSPSSSAAADVMLCSLPPHRQALAFPTYEAYEVHYAQAHVNRCLECGSNFPTTHYLALHIAENHDPLNEARKARGEKIYGCFIEDCDRKCSTPQKRRRHLIDKHLFPKDYDFYIINDGIDRRGSMLRSRGSHRRRSSATFDAAQRDQQARQRSATVGASLAQTEEISMAEGAEGMQLPEPPSSSHAGRLPSPPELDASPSPSRVEDPSMADLTSSMSALKFVPPSVRFGRGKKSGFAR